MDLSHIKPTYTTPNAHADTPTIQTTLTTLSLHPHPEGGFFAETDRNPLRIPNPHSSSSSSFSSDENDDNNNDTRSASSSILYYLTPRSPLGAFHRNASRTVHTLHRGRGRYVILHADAETRAKHGGKAAVETFVVGGNISRGERLQWVVEGGRYKASFLLSDDDGDGDGGGLGSDGLLISEVSELASCMNGYTPGRGLGKAEWCRLSSQGSNIKIMTFYARRKWMNCSRRSKRGS